METFKQYLQEVDGQQLKQLFDDLAQIRQVNAKLYQDANAVVQNSKTSASPANTVIRVIARDIRELAQKVDGEIAQGIQRMNQLMHGT